MIGDRIGEPITFPGDRASGQAARRTVRERASKVVTDSDTLDDIELMTAEAVANAVLHGSGQISIDVRVVPEGLRFEISDQGPADADLGDPNHRRTDHGRGLMVIDALAADWALDQSTTGTRMWFTVLV